MARSHRWGWTPSASPLLPPRLLWGLTPFPHLLFCPDTGNVPPYPRFWGQSLISPLFFSCPMPMLGAVPGFGGDSLLPPQTGEQIWQSKYLKTNPQTKITSLTLVINLCEKLTGKFTLTEVSAKCPSPPCPLLGLMGAQFILFIFHFQLNILLLNFNWNIRTCSALNLR